MCPPLVRLADSSDDDDVEDYKEDKPLTGRGEDKEKLSWSTPRRILESNKNLLLVLMLGLALLTIGVALRCETKPEYCASIGRFMAPRHLLYAGLGLILMWCCCPCCKLECQDVDLESRSCFLRAIQRRRRLRRARATGRPTAAFDEEEEP